MSQNDCCLPSVQNATCDEDTLLGCHVATQPFQVIAGTYARGDILFKTGTAGELTNKATTPAALDTDAFAIMPFSGTYAANEPLAVYVMGEMNQDKVIGATDIGVVKQTLSERGIKLRKFN